MESTDDKLNPLWYKTIPIVFATGIVLGWTTRRFFTLPPAIRSNIWNWCTVNYKLVLVVRANDPLVNKSQLAVHCSSASILAFETASKQWPISCFLWTFFGQRKVVLRSTYGYDFDELCRKASNRMICTSLIKQNNPTRRAGVDEEHISAVLAIGPGPERILNQISGDLKLY